MALLATRVSLTWAAPLTRRGPPGPGRVASSSGVDDGEAWCEENFLRKAFGQLRPAWGNPQSPREEEESAVTAGYSRHVLLTLWLPVLRPSRLMPSRVLYSENSTG